MSRNVNKWSESCHEASCGCPKRCRKYVKSQHYLRGCPQLCQELCASGVTTVVDSYLYQVIPVHVTWMCGKTTAQALTTGS